MAEGTQDPDLRPHRFRVSEELADYIAWNDTENCYYFIGEARDWIKENTIKVYLDLWGARYLYVFGVDDAVAFMLRWHVEPC